MEEITAWKEKVSHTSHPFFTDLHEEQVEEEVLSLRSK